ncbi:AAA family ATPase [Candidatus Palauibacter sp.]|uniref:AAA family ATPase n=1 Tax=Candidatus Palauibacter sp. TaxID=3101350 RepID=UPI003B0111E2
MGIAAKNYNPGFLSDADLRAMFCVRTFEFRSIIETLRENTGPSNQHVIVIGPRGSGKTTLLLRVASEIRSDPELSSPLYPIMFAEESYGVGTCGEFWLEALSRLARQIPGEAGRVNLSLSVEDLRREQDDRRLHDRCLGALLDFADREGKRLVLGVENLNMMFSDMTDRDAGWRLRQTLQTEPQIMLVGTATSRFGEIDRPDRALYELFRELTLRPLDREESAVLCERVAGRPVEPGAARRLQIITGGSPRLLAIMARFAAETSFDALMADLLDLVDEHTAYFKSHLESLPAQERRVYLALLELWRPSTAREVAERARMETSACSAQLRRLMGRGVVSEAGGTARRRQYYASERLYAIYYLLRRSRGADGLARALVAFMEAYYAKPALEALADRMVADASTLDPAVRHLWDATLRRLSRSPVLASHFVREHPRYVDDDVREAIEAAAEARDRAAEALEGGDPACALEIWEGVLHEFEAFERVSPKVSPALRNEVAAVLGCKALCLRDLGRLEESLVTCDEVVRQFDVNDHAEAVASVLTTRSRVLREMERTVEEMEVYAELARRFGSGDELPTRARVLLAESRVLNAEHLFRLERPDESITEFEKLVEHFGESPVADIREVVAYGLFLKAAVLSSMNRVLEQRATYDEMLQRLDESDRLAEASESSAWNKADALRQKAEVHMLRFHACIRLGNQPTAVGDIQTVLGILPELDGLPEGLIGDLVSASLVLGFGEMATLIQESPSSAQLLPLTTALELKMGLEPRVAIEVREVAEDIRRELAHLKRLESAERPETSR